MLIQTPFTRYSRLFNRLFGRFDNRLYRVNWVTGTRIALYRRWATCRAVDGGVEFAEVEQEHVRCSGDAQQSTVDTEVHPVYGQRTVVVVVVVARTTSLRLVEQLGRLQLVQHLQAHCQHNTPPSAASPARPDRNFNPHGRQFRHPHCAPFNESSNQQFLKWPKWRSHCNDPHCKEVR